MQYGADKPFRRGYIANRMCNIFDHCENRRGKREVTSVGKDVLVLPSNWPIPEDDFRANVLDGALLLSDGPLYTDYEELERSVFIISKKNLPKFIEWLSKQAEALAHEN